MRERGRGIMQGGVEECRVGDRKEAKEKVWGERDYVCVKRRRKRKKTCGESVWGAEKEGGKCREREKECGEREGRERKNMDKREGGIECREKEKEGKYIYSERGNAVGVKESESGKSISILLNAYLLRVRK